MENILNEREKRIAFQENIIKEYGIPLVFLRVNYPGLNKINEITRGIIKNVYVDFIKTLNEEVHLELYNETSEGPNYTALINCDGYILKKIAATFEETHPLGRLVDIDVYDSNGYKNISRNDLKMPLRKCFLCSKDAFVCIREKNHTEKDLVDYINNSYNKYRGT